MEAIVVIVGFLGTGKTTLLKKVTKEFLGIHWNPSIILNDYENANLDAQDFQSFLGPKQVSALSGSCICCTGVNELREHVNDIAERERGITLIEANGTTDAVSLMGFLGVGMKERFLPPVQIAVVDVRHWQKRGYHNELERNQVQVSSVIVLNFVDQTHIERVVEVEQDLRIANPKATIVHWDKLDITSFAELQPSDNEAFKMDHHKSHWSSCSVDLPDPISFEKLTKIIEGIPGDILRVKGCARVDNQEGYSHFERIPSGEVFVTSYGGEPIAGAKLLTIGPGSDPQLFEELIKNT